MKESEFTLCVEHFVPRLESNQSDNVQISLNCQSNIDNFNRLMLHFRSMPSSVENRPPLLTPSPGLAHRTCQLIHHIVKDGSRAIECPKDGFSPLDVVDTYKHTSWNDGATDGLIIKPQPEHAVGTSQSKHMDWSVFLFSLYVSVFACFCALLAVQTIDFNSQTSSEILLGNASPFSDHGSFNHNIQKVNFDQNSNYSSTGSRNEANWLGQLTSNLTGSLSQPVSKTSTNTVEPWVQQNTNFRESGNSSFDVVAVSDNNPSGTDSRIIDRQTAINSYTGNGTYYYSDQVTEQPYLIDQGVVYIDSRRVFVPETGSDAFSMNSLVSLKSAPEYDGNRPDNSGAYFMHRNNPNTSGSNYQIRFVGQ